MIWPFQNKLDPSKTIGTQPKLFGPSKIILEGQGMSVLKAQKILSKIDGRSSFFIIAIPFITDVSLNYLQ